MNMETGEHFDVGSRALADWLRDKIDNLGWMQKTLAERSGLSPATISDLINEKQELSAETAEKLADVFELKITAPQLLRMAGLFKNTYIEPNKRELALSMFQSLAPEEQDLALDIMNLLRQREKGTVETTKRQRKT